MGRHAEWTAACRLHAHELKVAIGRRVEESVAIIKEMQTKRSEKLDLAIGAHLQVSEMTFDSKSSSYRLNSQWASALGIESDDCLLWHDLNFTVPKWDADQPFKQELKAAESFLGAMGNRTILAVVAPLHGDLGLKAEVAITQAAQNKGHTVHRFHIILEASADWAVVRVTSLLLCGTSAAWGSNGDGTPCAIAERIMQSKAWNARACVKVPVLNGPGSDKVRNGHRNPSMERQWGRAFYTCVFNELNLGLTHDLSGGPLIPRMKFLELDAGVGHACRVIAEAIATREETAAQGEDSLKEYLKVFPEGNSSMKSHNRTQSRRSPNPHFQHFPYTQNAVAAHA